MSSLLNDPGVRDKIIEHWIKATESTAYLWENLTKGVQDSGKRAGTHIFEASKDFECGDIVCDKLCTVSSECEVIADVLVWCIITGNITTVDVLKGASIGCQRFRDLCAQD